MVLLLSLLRLASVSLAQGGPQWPQPLENPLWKPKTGYIRPTNWITGRPFVGPELVLRQPKGTVRWSLIKGPPGMAIDEGNRIVWSNPVSGGFLVKVQAEDESGAEQVDWNLCVRTPEDPNVVVHSTKHLDFIVPPEYDKWMTESGADGVADGYYEFTRDLLGGTPSSARQCFLYRPSIWGAESGNPISIGKHTMGDNDSNRWRLGFMFHEMGHNLSDWTRVGYIEHGDDLADNTLHDMVEFLKNAWVHRLLNSPTTQGVVNVPPFEEWMKFESTEFAGSFDQFQTSIKSGDNFSTTKIGASAVWAGMVERFSIKYGSEVLEKTMRSIRRDGIPLMDYPQGKLSGSERLSIVMGVMARVSGEDRREEFKAMGMPLNVAVYNKMYSAAGKQIANPPPLGKNGACRCPADGRYYVLTPYPTTWDIGESMARRMGGHLATIRTVAQEKWLADKYGAFGWNWVGGQRSKDGSWSWITGERTGPAVWEPERPESDPAKTSAVLVLHEDAGKPPWFGLANRPPEEWHFGIIEMAAPPSVDVDCLK